MKITDFNRKKERGEKISMLTCYDYPSARIVAESNLDGVLVGDSVAMVVHGYDSTLMATMDMMVLHTQAVARGTQQQLIISDLPFLCHRVSKANTVLNVKRLLQAGAHAIKLEGADAQTCKIINHLVTSGVPVIGHIGLTPQSFHQLGGYRVQGRNDAQAADLLVQATRLEQSGCAAVVIECVPHLVVKTITDSLKIPTIGIGAGMATDGQILVWHDMLGLQNDFKPRFLKQFAHTKETMLGAINTYVDDVRQVRFPTIEHAF
jgi:3-methyl-2-oxobutanoate hydroxymethyltransferase